MRKFIFCLLLCLCTFTSFADTIEESRKKGIEYYNAKQYTEAYNCLSVAAKSGDAEAQSFLSLMYFLGNGVDKNMRLAALWMRAAELNGQVGAYDFYCNIESLGGKATKEEARRFIDNNYCIDEAYVYVNLSQIGNAGLNVCARLNDGENEEVKLTDKNTLFVVKPNQDFSINLVCFVLSNRLPFGRITGPVASGETVYYICDKGKYTLRSMTEKEIAAARKKVPTMMSLPDNNAAPIALASTAQPAQASPTAPAAPKTTVAQTPSQPQVVTLKSDVDLQIPEAKTAAQNTFAVIISNENYQNVSKVDYARNDGKIFSQYCHKTLGIPQDHIYLREDATFGNMESVLSRIEKVGSAYEGDLNIIFYYAGHGIPDEKTRDAFLIPIDGDGSMLNTCIRTSTLYKRLAAINARSVVVFMDACFSGAVRGDGMLASARGVRIAPKEETVGGKMVVFTAAHGDETAYPYSDQEHGLFTYFLLKNLQETSGNVKLGDMMDYVQSSVKKTSIVKCGHMQTPTVLSSDESSDWRDWSLLK